MRADLFSVYLSFSPSSLVLFGAQLTEMTLSAQVLQSGLRKQMEKGVKAQGLAKI